jgi:hypothetical protein
MTRILYVKKKSKDGNWSDVLKRQFNTFKKLNSDQMECFEIDTSSAYRYLKAFYLLFKKRNQFNVIHVNHIVCAYPCIIPKLFSRRSIKWHLALHETEPVLGIRYALKNIKHLSLKEIIRYTSIMDLPLLFFNKKFVLNDRQKKYRFLNYQQVNFLGVDTEKFNADLPKKENESNEINFFFSP